MNFFLLSLIGGLTGLTLNWWYFYYRKVLNYRKQKKQLNAFLGKLKVVEVYSKESKRTKIFTTTDLTKNLTSEYFIKISYPERVDENEFWGKNTFYREFNVYSPQGTFLKSYRTKYRNGKTDRKFMKN
jgi:hypothetical protein